MAARVGWFCRDPPSPGRGNTPGAPDGPQNGPREPPLSSIQAVNSLLEHFQEAGHARKENVPLIS